jgi:hypothetical protein
MYRKLEKRFLKIIDVEENFVALAFDAAPSRLCELVQEQNYFSDFISALLWREFFNYDCRCQDKESSLV